MNKTTKNLSNDYSLLKLFLQGILFIVAVFVEITSIWACSSLLVTKGASADGSCFITYSIDSPGTHSKLLIIPASDASTQPENGSPHIPQEIPTYKVLGVWDINRKVESDVLGMINEHQLAIGETTFRGYAELRNQFGELQYPELITIALQRSKTAREAIAVMAKAVDDFGYIGPGESISICDPNEVWVFEICGTGATDAENNSGSVWVAKRVPDGQITAHTNHARIREFPLNDPENCLYSSNVISFAIEKGLFDPKSGKAFSFADAYGNLDLFRKRIGEKRVWSLFNRISPSLALSDDYVQGKEDAKPYPWSITPDQKLSLVDVMSLIRNRYEGTPYDMTQGIDAGFYGNPTRPQSLNWQLGEDEYCWDYSISTPMTGCSMIAQVRDFVPNELGVLWFGWDDTAMTCYSPLYIAMNELPNSGTITNINQFDINSAFWLFNLVSNFAYPRYRDVYPDIQKVQKELESKFIRLQPVIEKTAQELYNQGDWETAEEYLTDYSLQQTEKVYQRWRQLANDLFVKFNDSLIRTKDGDYSPSDIPQNYLQKIIEEKGEQLRLSPKK
ncbi:MAG: C69 family dipeptidase [Planctomycetia bacterium]|nr:C69 family dipeptidase [Planctomycetia bacterium]